MYAKYIKAMTVQEFIERLNKVEDKNRIVVTKYDGSYPIVRDEDINEATLYTDDNCGSHNIEDYRQDNDEEVKCLYIYSGG